MPVSGEPIDEFSARFVRRVGDRYSLIERPGGDCVFWDRQAGCTVYAARPVQCQTWPFWPENVETEEDWAGSQAGLPGIRPGPALQCPGDHRIDREGPPMTLEEAHDGLHEPDRLAEIRLELRRLYQDVDQAVSDLNPDLRSFRAAAAGFTSMATRSFCPRRKLSF